MKNVVLRGSVYHFRKSLPEDIYDTSLRREITFSLKTKSKRLARSKAAAVLGAIDASIYEIRLSTSLRRKKSIFKKLITYLDEFRSTGKGRFQKVVVTSSSPPQKKPMEPSIKLDEACTQFIEEKMKMDWGKKTKDSYSTSLNCLLVLMGNISVKAITKAHVVEFLQQLMEYPSCRNRGANRKLTIEELKARGVPPISPPTIKKIFVHISTFFNWLHIRDYIDANYFKGLTPKGRKTISKNKDPFTDKDLQLLFGRSLLQHKHSIKPWRFWIPTLALYTGARLEELAQLNTDDIKCLNDVYYLDIHEQGANQLKTPHSIRKIPLHIDIIEAGLFRYAESRAGAEKLFTLGHLEGTYGKLVSQWFTRVKNKLNFPATKVFHSFRHTFRDLAVESRVPSEHIKALLGHTQGDMTHGVYGSGFSLSLLNESVQQIDFSCVRDILIPSGIET